MTAAQLIIACLLLPAAGALGVALAGRRPGARAAAALASAGLLLAALLALARTVWAGGVPQLFVLELLPGVALGFRVEPLGLLFALAVAMLWLAQLVRRGGDAAQVTMAGAVAATTGMALAANLATLVLFGAVLTSMVRARAAWLGAAAALLAAGLLATWLLAGSLEFLPGGILRGKAPGAVLTALAALYLLGLGAWALPPPRHGLRAAAGAFAALKLLVYVFGVAL